MLRISRILKEADRSMPTARRPGTSGIVVIWNLTNRCNLSCPHCYTHATPKKLSNELDTLECKKVIDDMARQKVMVLILSGGEPVLRSDLYDIATYAQDNGISCALSTNGTLINKLHVEKILKSGIGYVGISIDGIGDSHDKFRGKKGAYAASLNAIRLCRDAGLKVGLRLSLTAYTAHEMPEIFELFEKEKLVKLYISHLNYSDVSSKNLSLDKKQIRKNMQFVMQKSFAYMDDKNITREIVTGNNDADGPFLYLSIQKENKQKAKEIYNQLVMIGGNSSGIRLANIDPLGEVHPDPFCRGISLGNVRKKTFDKIWKTPDQAFVVSLRDRKKKFHGRCGRCRFIDLCGGNSRARAYAHTGDWWGSDPLCYLTNEEISGEITE